MYHPSALTPGACFCVIPCGHTAEPMKVPSCARLWWAGWLGCCAGSGPVVTLGSAGTGGGGLEMRLGQQDTGRGALCSQLYFQGGSGPIASGNSGQNESRWSGSAGLCVGHSVVAHKEVVSGVPLYRCLLQKLNPACFIQLSKFQSRNFI